MKPVITFALFGLPSNLLVKRFGPKKILPFLLMAVGAVLVGAGCCSSPAAWFSLRLCKHWIPSLPLPPAAR
jgi:sugar phosphate permease